MTYENIEKVNKLLKTTDIKGKQYIDVSERIKAFRMLYPEGQIITELVEFTEELCVFRAEVRVEGKVLGTGTAFEYKNSSFINKTSFVENCETSAVGRALAMCGIGIDTSVASYEEVANAIQNQEQPKKMTKEERIEQLHEVPGYPSKEEMLNEEKKFYENKPEDLEKLYKYWKVKSLEDLTAAQLAVLYKKHHK